MSINTQLTEARTARRILRAVRAVRAHKDQRLIREERPGARKRLFGAEGLIRRPMPVVGLLLVPVVFVPVMVTQLVGVVASLVESERRHSEAASLQEASHAEVRFPNSAQDLDQAGMLLAPFEETFSTGW